MIAEVNAAQFSARVVLMYPKILDSVDWHFDCLQLNALISASFSVVYGFHVFTLRPSFYDEPHQQCASEALEAARIVDGDVMPICTKSKTWSILHGFVYA